MTPVQSINFSALAEPFKADEIEWRIGQAGKATNGKFWGKALAYITNRAIMQRLDDVCGASNWRNEFQPSPTGSGVLCGISIRVNTFVVDGVQHTEWVTKWDGADNTEIEATKGGLSGSMKRAAVQWGIGRYLYDLSENWVVPDPNGQYTAKTPFKNGSGGEFFKWNAPLLPAWALPQGTQNGSEQRGAPATQVEAEAVEPADEGVIAYIRTHGPKIPAGTEIIIARTKYQLVDFIRANWGQVRSDKGLASYIAERMEEVTGEPIAAGTV